MNQPDNIVIEGQPVPLIFHVGTTTVVMDDTDQPEPHEDEEEEDQK